MQRHGVNITVRYRDLAQAAKSVAEDLGCVMERGSNVSDAREYLSEFGRDAVRWVETGRGPVRGGLLRPYGIPFFAAHASKFFEENPALAYVLAGDDKGKFDVIKGIGLVLAEAQETDKFDRYVPGLRTAFRRIAGHASLVSKPRSKYYATEPPLSRWIDVSDSVSPVS